jgi:hypothetical protein
MLFSTFVLVAKEREHLCDIFCYIPMESSASRRTTVCSRVSISASETSRQSEAICRGSDWIKKNRLPYCYRSQLPEFQSRNSRSDRPASFCHPNLRQFARPFPPCVPSFLPVHPMPYAVVYVSVDSEQSGHTAHFGSEGRFESRGSERRVPRQSSSCFELKFELSSPLTVSELCRRRAMCWTQALWQRMGARTSSQVVLDVRIVLGCHRIQSIDGIPRRH